MFSPQAPSLDRVQDKYKELLLMKEREIIWANWKFYLLNHNKDIITSSLTSIDIYLSKVKNYYDSVDRKNYINSQLQITA
jgi:CRISPR/Cas system-associated endonuclease Cas3-HD